MTTPAELDPLLDEKPSRYVVGMDLGTTNSAVAYVDATKSPWRVQDFAVPQIVAPGQVEARGTLPSFHYQPAEGEFAADAIKLPWSKQPPGHVVGFFARDQGAVVPGRLIASAKSWLCHTGVDRTRDLLPWQGASDVERLSPVEVSARYLRHVRAAWNAKFPSEPLEKQDFVLTLPASFDEVARELTVQAAAKAGLERVVLIEEPQAAFYSWIDNHRDTWEQHVAPGQKILVCDIGGGTSDFTLIRVRRGEGEKIQFHRVAVGDHLILGGDNLDLTLAHHLEQRLSPNGKLSPHQWSVLVRTCRQVKETLLGENPPPSLTIHLPGSGSRLLGGGMQCEVTAAEVAELLAEGFLPRVTLDTKPAGRRSGFTEFGLPFATDHGITKYLAAFLTAHRHAGDDASDTQTTKQHDPSRPDIVLFNGGFFASPMLRARLIDELKSWFVGESSEDKNWSPHELQNDRLDLAVARGAAYFGMVRRGEGVKISAGLARTYYIGVDSDPPAAICLAPASAEPGQDIELPDRQFELLVSNPVEFPLYVSSTRLIDRPGELVPIDREQMTPLPPIRTVLRVGRRSESQTIAVKLHAKLTEIGTLDLWCAQVNEDRSWRLQFDVRSATETDVDAHEGAGETQGFIDEQTWQESRQAIQQVFAEPFSIPPDGLVKKLAETTGIERSQWPTTLLRRYWEALMDSEAGRRKSQQHETRWLNLLGFSLRPGYGLAVDDWRVAETWRLLQGKLIHNSPASRAESLILWRRIAGGLSAGQQQAVAAPLLGPLRALHRRSTTGQTKGSETPLAPQDAPEVLRLLGSLELLSVPQKIELGEMLLDLLGKKKLEAAWPTLVWSLGRVGARVPVYGPLNTVVPGEKVSQWLAQLLKLNFTDPQGHLAVMQLARLTDDRYRDLPEPLRVEAIAWLRGANASPHLIELIEHTGSLDAEEQGKIFGEALPKGLRISAVT